MSETLQKININGREYEFFHEPEKKQYTFNLDNCRFRFKRWSWGEKNRVTNQCVVFNPDTGRFEVNTIDFNERMLADTMIEMEKDGQLSKPTLETVKEFNASLGDRLLAVSQWINAVDFEPGNSADNGYSLSETPGDDGTYQLSLNGDIFKIGTWTWGEKNRVTDRSVAVDPESGQLKMDLGVFNESLLLATLKEARINGKSLRPDKTFLSALDAATGDILLQAAQEINNISDGEKKN